MQHAKNPNAPIATRVPMPEHYATEEDATHLYRPGPLALGAILFYSNNEAQRKRPNLWEFGKRKHVPSGTVVWV